MQLQEQFLNLQQAQAAAVPSQPEAESSAQPEAEPSAQVLLNPTLSANLEQAIPLIQEHEAFIQHLKNKELPAFLQLSQKVVTKQVEHSEAIAKTRDDVAKHLTRMHTATQEAFLKQGGELQALGQHIQTTNHSLQNLDRIVKEDVQVDVMDLRNIVNAVAIEVSDMHPGRRRQVEVDSDPEIEVLFQESMTPFDAKKGEGSTQAGPSSLRSQAAKRGAETRRKNQCLKEETEIRRRKAEEAKAKEEAKKKQEENKQD
ncbi:unnamed protein product [Cuscuta europaea]|uniref:Uncharacterized protein n=1 Tax=Cuscuta europaea TaxID=41803 RepID=A0A9P0ZFA8_CUSEU|nr:unnamed protein product [Cuscuta europaea]